MAVELCSENCGVSTMSPRISFSHDFSQSDVIPVEQNPFRSNSSGLNSSFDFDVCVREQESSSADELFSDGKMLPTEIKKKMKMKMKMKKNKAQSPVHQTQVQPRTQTVRENASTKKESLKEQKQQQHDEVDEKQNSNNSNKSFWGFKRSSSCGSGGYGRSLCPLPLLSRSNSTGSAPNNNTSTNPSVNKRMPISKEGHNNMKHHHPPPHIKHAHPTSTNHTTRPYQKPPLKKIHGPYVHNGVRVNPVINVPSANLFGLGSIFTSSSSNRDKSKKK